MIIRPYFGECDECNFRPYFNEKRELLFATRSKSVTDDSEAVRKSLQFEQNEQYEHKE
jgi:hypothetical protein